jgi:hypothetical protein
MLLLSPPLELTGLRPGLPPEGTTFFNTDSRTECLPPPREDNQRSHRMQRGHTCSLSGNRRLISQRPRIRAKLDVTIDDIFANQLMFQLELLQRTRVR